MLSVRHTNHTSKNVADTTFNDEESCKENYIGILKTRAKEYEKDLNQVMAT